MRFQVMEHFPRRAAVRPLLLAGLSSLLLTGCCLSFERDWKAARCLGVPSCPSGPASASGACPDAILAGAWEGTWESEINGHHGRLRAVITPRGDGRYHARFHATFAVILPYEYEVCLTGAKDDAIAYFSGEADLGCLAGGVYRCSGCADQCEFIARYCAKKDKGTFRMRRVSGVCVSCAEPACR